MKLDIVKQLVEILKNAPEVGAIEIRRGPFGAWSAVRVSKAGYSTTAAGAEHALVAQAPGTTAPPPPSPLPPPRSAGEGGGGRGEGAVAAHLLEIKSPMVGTYYSAPEPGAAPYAKAGSRVTVGQVVCIIEAMKIMNEIEAEIAGVIKEVCLENAQPVEFGQVLFRVDPHA